jgi:hypothetical protein
MAVSGKEPRRCPNSRVDKIFITHPTLFAVGGWLEETRVGAAIAEGRYAFPIIEGIHLIGLAVAVGLLMLVDLRLMGVFLTQVPPRQLHRQLLPYVLAGFGVIVLAGVLLLSSEATTVFASPPWPFKMVFLALGACNALYFEFVSSRRPDALPTTGQLPAGVRAAGAASFALWVLVIICGRLIPYVTTWG